MQFPNTSQPHATAAHRGATGHGCPQCMARRFAQCLTGRLAQPIDIDKPRQAPLSARSYPVPRKLAEAPRAQMAELVDAPASGAGARKGVEVRVLFWAPFVLFRSATKLPDHSSEFFENP